MNKKHVILFLLISITMGVISYVILDNLYIALGVFVFYALFSLIFICPLFKKYDQLSNKYKECYQFENNLVLALSIKKYLEPALESAVTSMSSEFVEFYNSFEQMSAKEKLEYLSTYFDFSEYQMFLQTLNTWDEKGGDILQMSKYLTSNLKANDERISQFEQLNKKKYYEIAVLWTLCFLMMVFVKYCLKDFYSQIKTKPTYIITFVVICAFALLTTFLLVYKSTQFIVRRFQKDEKTI